MSAGQAFVGWLKRNRRYRQLIYLVFFLVVLLDWLIETRTLSISVLWLGLFGLLLLVPLKDGWLKDWQPLWLVPFAYGSMRSLTLVLQERVNVFNIINWEHTLFGGLPTVEFQQLWHVADQVLWYDVTLLFSYLTFYLMPFGVALYLYLADRQFFHAFADGFAVLTVAGFCTYVLFPAMPPWLASQLGYLPAIPHLLVETANQTLHLSLSAIYASVGANQIAAMPSLHAAWPWFSAGCLYLFYRARALPWFIFPALISLAIIYFGEHYLIDVIAGIAYAVLAIFMVGLKHRRQLDKKIVA